jgi:hypothetical protein
MKPPLFLSLLAGLLAGSSGSGRPDLPPMGLSGPRPRDRKPSPPIQKKPLPAHASTNDLVVCIHCDAECGWGKGSGAKSTAIMKGWKKLSDTQFECPECRKGSI